MVKEKVERKVAYENCGEKMSKVEGKKRGRIVIKKEIATHYAKMVLGFPQHICKTC